MRVLFICHRFPYPPNRGGKIRPFNIIKALTGRGARVSVASMTRDEPEYEAIGGIGQHCERFYCARVNKWAQNLRMVSRLPTLTPSSMGYFYAPDLARTIRRWTEEDSFDVIFAHCSSVAGYASGLQARLRVLDFGDMDSQKWLDYSQVQPFPLSAGYWLEGRKLMRAEKLLTRQFDLCTVTTQHELETLNGYRTGVKTGWYPNGVDTDFFCPGEEPHEPRTLSFIGRMDYYPNQQAMIEFCRDTLPLLRARVPDIKLLIVGASPSPEILRLGELPGVVVTGSVPDVRPHVRRSAAMVAPLSLARGAQNKVLEAMAMGVPVVASPLAARGVDCVNGEHLLVAGTPAEYVERVMKLIEQPEERARLAEAGRRRAISHHSWSASMARLNGMMDEMLSGRSTAERISSPR